MDLRYPVTSLGVDTCPPQDPEPPSSSWTLPSFQARPGQRLAILCRRPFDHVLEFSQFFSLVEKLGRAASDLRICLWSRSALSDWTPFDALPVDSVCALPEDEDTPAWESLIAHLDREFRTAIVLDGAGSLRSLSCRTLQVEWLDGGSFSFETTHRESPECARASDAFHSALRREMPLWIGEDLGVSLPEEPRFLVHQSRFRVGNTLWLTPLLRTLRLFFPRSHITVAGSATTARVLQCVDLVDEILVLDPEGGKEARGDFLAELHRRRFDAALFALARREKSRWLAEAAAEMDVPCRVNLEYFQRPGDGREPSELFSHEGWFFWSAIASARFLLHGLDPLAPEHRRSDRDWLRDRRVEFPVREEWREEAQLRLDRLGIGLEPFVMLCPAGASSDRWPARSYAELALRLGEEFGFHALFEGGPGDREVLRSAMDWIDQSRNRGVGSGRRIATSQDSLGVLAALLERSSLLISNDSAPIHLSEATGTPTLYFSHHEKLTHSHPDGATHWALYDTRRNRLGDISPTTCLNAIQQKVLCGHFRPKGR